MANKKDKFARFGLATKGLVYLLIGGITAFSAIGWGDEFAGSSNAIDFLSKQPFGQVLIGITAVGLLGYVFFRWREAILGSFEDKNKLVAIITRIAFFGSGLFYGILAFSAAKKIIGTASSSGGSDFGLSSALNSSYGMAIAIAIGVILTVKTGYEFFLAYSGKFKERVSNSNLSSSDQQKLLKAGLVGHTARGIVFGVLSFLFYKAALSRNSSKMGQGEAFSFIEDSFGSLVLAVIALGVVSYGVFMMLSARYSPVQS